MSYRTHQDPDPTEAHGIERPETPSGFITPTTTVAVRADSIDTTPTPSVLDKALPIAASVGRWTVGITLWFFQYGFAVWCVYGWRITKACFKALGVLAFLLFVPVLGWLVLWLILRGRKHDRQHAELVAAVRGETTPGPVSARSLWSPWALAWVRGSK